MRNDVIRLPNGNFALIRMIPLHRRKPHSLYAYARPTDWIAAAGSMNVWGRTRREALANLKAAAESAN
jgi:hypothetical protein